MKTLRLIGLTFMMVLVAGCFTACSSDDDDSEVSPSRIVGTWILTMREEYKNNEMTSSKTYPDQYGYMYRLTFQENGTLNCERKNNDTSWYETENLAGNYFKYKDDFEAGKYELVGDVLYEIGSGNSRSNYATVKTLTKKQLVLETTQYHDVLYFDKN